MSSYYKILKFGNGTIHVLTKSRWMGVLPVPRTTVLPDSTKEFLRGASIAIRSQTSDPLILKALHEEVVGLVDEIGLAGMHQVQEIAKFTERVWKASGQPGSGFREMTVDAREHDVALHFSDLFLDNIKRFA